MSLFKHPDAVVLAPFVFFLVFMFSVMFYCVFTAR
jgi:hypothetical protein